MDLGTYLILLTLTLLIYVVFKKLTDSKPYPPGPRGWELVRAFLSSVNGTLPMEVEKWSQKYGDVVFCPLPTGSLVFVSSPKSCKELFGSKDRQQFTNDRMWSYPADKMCLRKCVTFTSPNDPAWNKMRKLLHSNLKLYGDGVAEFEDLVGKTLDEVMTTLEDKQGTDFMMMEEVIVDSIANIVANLITGEDTDMELHEAMKRLQACVLRLLNPTFTFAIRACPVIDHIPGTYHNRCRLEMEECKRDLMKILFYDMKNTRVAGSPRGIVDRILEYQSNEGADWMTDDHVKGMIIDIVVASIVTTSHALNSMMFFLLHHEDIMRNLQKEVDRVIGPGRKPTLKDRRVCHYTEAFILESLRMMVLTPLGLDHLVTKDVDLNGFCIPEGSTAFITTCVFHKSTELWSDPERLRPERFLDEEGKLLPANHPQRQSVLPFGVGKRSCPGETFAHARIFLYVTTILQQFDILPPQGEKLLPMVKDSWVLGAVNSLKPYHISLRRRE